jgi:peptidoglycan/LPS O-acetylase OafA/YrhL
MNDADGSPKLAPLTSLRFFAAAYVLALHSGRGWLTANGWLAGFAFVFANNGYLGVSFFFILSGFILHHVYHNKVWVLPNVRRFAAARFARIYPIYFVSVVIAGIFPPWDLSSIAQFFFLQKWMPSSVVVLSNWNGPAWTLSVEFLFYLTFPLASRYVRAASLPVIILVGGCLIFVMLGLQTPSIPTPVEEHGPYHWMGYVPVPLLRYPEFLYGILLCELCRRIKHPQWMVAAPWLVIGAIVITLSSSSSRGVAAPAALLFGALIYVVARSPRTLIFNILSGGWLVLLGGASYTLYVMQVPIRMVLAQSLPISVARWLYYPALFSISIMLFKYFEEPLRAKLRRLAEFNVAPRLPSWIWQTDVSIDANSDEVARE